MNEALAQGLAAIIQYLGPSPVLLTFVVLGIGPWAALIWVVLKLSKLIGKMSKEHGDRIQQVFERQDQRYDEAVRNYENNVEVVKITQGLAKSLNETVAYNTEVMTGVKASIEHNQFCPWVRQQMQPKIEG